MRDMGKSRNALVAESAYRLCWFVPLPALLMFLCHAEERLYSLCQVMKSMLE